VAGVDSEFWRIFVLVGLAGLGIGLGLVIGAFTARMLRRYMREERLNGVSQKDDD
jgi:NhaP-type Na+/H+ or K+/H+ antiporter